MGEKWVKSKGELPAPPSTIEESTKMGLIVPSAGYALAFVRMPLPLPQAVTHLPFAARVVLYYVMADFGLYWVHRLLHTKPLWRTHKWHHSPTYMYWLAGIRGSLPQQIVFTLPVMAAFPLLDLAPAWLLILIPYEAVVRNNCMHMNVTWRSNWLEWLIVTPAIANLFREGKTFQIPSMMQTGRGIGMQMLNDGLLALVKSKTVAPEEAYLKAVDKSGLATQLRAAGIHVETGLDN